MSRPVGLSLTAVSAVRTITGSPVAADSSTLTDTNFPPTPDDVTGGAVNCFGFKTINVGAEFTGGTSPTISFEILIRDDGAADGSRWKRLQGFTAIALDGTNFVEVKVDGRLVFLRLTQVTGAPTGVTLLGYPGERLPGRAFY